MLDFEADGIGQLNTIAGYFVASALVCLGVAIAAGAVMLAAGRGSGLSRSQEKGLKMIGIGAAGAMVLASLGGAIAWSIERGQTGLMPEQARQQDVVVEREAPKTHCTEQAVRNFDEEENPPPQEKRREILRNVVHGEVPDSMSEALIAEDQSSHATTSLIHVLKWRPDGVGGDCSTSNESAAECTEIELETSVKEVPNSRVSGSHTVGSDCE